MPNQSQVEHKSPAQAKAHIEAQLQSSALAGKKPVAAVVLGSGVSVLEGLHDPVVIAFEDVFGMAPGVSGHSGSLTIGRLNAGDDKVVAVLRGRFHLYEGWAWDAVTLAAATIVEWGVPNLLLTNAAGGLNKTFAVGDLMVLSGYRDLLNPKLKETGLLQALLKEATPVSNALSEKLIATGAKLCQEDKAMKALQTGVYAALLGPSYETMAEISMLRKLKCDAVGMSTAPELITCNGTGTTAAAVSVITNVWNENVAMGGHDEVLEASKAASKRLDKLFRAVLSEL